MDETWIPELVIVFLRLTQFIYNLEHPITAKIIVYKVVLIKKFKMKVTSKNES